MTSREQFEKWAEEHYTSTRKRGDDYHYHDTQLAWEAWQASRAWMPIESAPKITGALIIGRDNLGNIEIMRFSGNGWVSNNTVYFPDEWQYLPE